MDLREYLQSNTAATKNFFYQNVRRITGKDPRISRGEKVYVAGFLTMYAELSSIRPTLPHFSNASEIKEFFAALSNTTGKPEYWEAGGEQTLFVNGFFRGETDDKSVAERAELYDYLGYSFYHTAHKLSVDP